MTAPSPAAKTTVAMKATKNPNTTISPVLCRGGSCSNDLDKPPGDGPLPENRVDSAA
jgi:hypothetical protein